MLIAKDFLLLDKRCRLWLIRISLTLLFHSLRTSQLQFYPDPLSRRPRPCRWTSWRAVSGPECPTSTAVRKAPQIPIPWPVAAPRPNSSPQVQITRLVLNSNETSSFSRKPLTPRCASCLPSQPTCKPRRDLPSSSVRPPASVEIVAPAQTAPTLTISKSKTKTTSGMYLNNHQPRLTF